MAGDFARGGVEIVRDGGFLFIRGHVEQPEQQEERHHRRYEVSVSHFPGTTMVTTALDDFFDNGMVMVEDPSLRDNRLCLLRDISGLFSGLADFSKIVLKKS